MSPLIGFDPWPVNITKQHTSLYTKSIILCSWARVNEINSLQDLSLNSTLGCFDDVLSY